MKRYEGTGKQFLTFFSTELGSGSHLQGGQVTIGFRTQYASNLRNFPRMRNGREIPLHFTLEMFTEEWEYHMSIAQWLLPARYASILHPFPQKSIEFLEMEVMRWIFLALCSSLFLPFVPWCVLPRLRHIYRRYRHHVVENDPVPKRGRLGDIQIYNLYIP